MEEKKIIFRQKGEKKEFIIGSTLCGFYISVNNGEKRIEKDDMPNVVDLTNVPVVLIGGKKGQIRRANLEFFKKNAPDFKGAILLLPYSWANGWDDGILMIPSESMLNSSEKISGGKPELSLNNFRFLPDGRYVADQVRLLHGKVIEILATEVEQIPSMSQMVEWVTSPYSSTTIILYLEVQEVIKKLFRLESLRILKVGGESTKILEVVKNFLVSKFKELGIQKFSDISENFSITAEAVMPELVAEESTLGKILIPGVGEKKLLKRWEESFCGNFAMIELSFDEMKSVTEWPYTDVAFEVTEISLISAQGYERDHMKSGTLRNLLSSEGEGRWQKILGYFQECWIKIQRNRKYPKDEQTVDAHLFDLPADFEPFNWGYDFITGEKFYAYPAIAHILYAPRGYFIDKGWWIRWFDSAEEAERVDFNSREEARSYARSREITETLKATEITPCPFDIPETYQEEILSQEYIMSLTGLAPDKYIIEKEVNFWYYSGSSSYRDYDSGKMQCGESGWATCVNKIDGVFHIGTSAFNNLFDKFYCTSVSAYSHLYSEGLFCLLELPKEKIDEIKNILNQRKENRLNQYKILVESTKERILNSKEFKLFPKSLQSQICDEYSSLGSLRDDILNAWSQASHLLSKDKFLVNFGGHFRMMGAANNEDYFVVSYDGLIRQADTISYRKAYRSEGEKLWNFVGQNETALYYSQYDGLKVVKEPIKYTESQKQSIEQIKKDLFGDIVYETKESSDREEENKPEVEESDREITLEDIKKLQDKLSR